MISSNANNISVVLDHAGSDRNDTSTPTKCAAFTVGPMEIYITIHVLTLLVSLVGNILIIAAYVRMKENILLPIANMAASDLLTALFLMPRLLTREFTRSNVFLVRGGTGTFLCKMCTFLSDVSLSVSTQSVLLIATERFLAIVYPLLYKKVFTVKRCYLFVALTWIASMAIHSPYFYIFRLSADNTCQPNWEPAFDHESTQPRYLIFLFITVLFLPLLSISVLYGIIHVKLQRDKLASSRTERGAVRHQERSRKLQRMGIATIIAFLLCWTLYIGISVFKLFSPNAQQNCNIGFRMVDHISRVLVSCYPAVNASICFIFVQGFTQQLIGMCRRKRQPSVTTEIVQDWSAENNCSRIRSESAQTLSSLLITRNGNNCSLVDSHLV